jgi:serine/threonine-protein kinase
MAMDDLGTPTSTEHVTHTQQPPTLERQGGPPPGGGWHVPDLIGLAATEAYPAARAANVRLTVKAWETSVGPWGLVVDQQPAAGTHVRRGSRLAVVVSCRLRAPVPDVTGLTLEAALERLVWLGLVPLVIARRPSVSVAPGHIESTRPAPGSVAACGTVVALTVARASTSAPVAFPSRQTVAE